MDFVLFYFLGILMSFFNLSESSYISSCATARHASEGRLRNSLDLGYHSGYRNYIHCHK